MPNVKISKYLKLSKPLLSSNGERVDSINMDGSFVLSEFRNSEYVYYSSVDDSWYLDLDLIITEFLATNPIAGVAGNGIASTVDNGNGTITFNYTDGTSFTTSVLSGTPGPPGTVEFYYQDTLPVPDPTNLGAIWIDSDNNTQYIWVFDGTNNVWLQTNYLYKTIDVNTSLYDASFLYEYYGVTYTSGQCTINLPIGDITKDEGRKIIIADETGNISRGNRGILVQGQSGQLINGESSVLMKLDNMSLTFVFRNNSWKTI